MDSPDHTDSPNGSPAVSSEIRVSPERQNIQTVVDLDGPANLFPRHLDDASTEAPSWIDRFSPSASEVIVRQLDQRCLGVENVEDILDQLSNMSAIKPLMEHDGRYWQELEHYVVQRPGALATLLSVQLPPSIRQERERGMIIHGPDYFDTLVEKNLVTPLIIDAIRRHFERHPKPVHERRLLDGGSSPAVLRALQEHIGTIVTYQPDDNRYLNLTRGGHTGMKVQKAWLRDVAVGLTKMTETFDVVLLNRFLDTISQHEDTGMIKKWLPEAVSSNGASIIIQDNVGGAPGTRSHLLASMVNGRQPNGVSRYNDLLSGKGLHPEIRRASMQLQAKTMMGQVALHDVMQYNLPRGVPFTPAQFEAYQASVLSQNGSMQFGTSIASLLTEHGERNTTVAVPPAPERQQSTTSASVAAMLRTIQQRLPSAPPPAAPIPLRPPMSSAPPAVPAPKPPVAPPIPAAVKPVQPAPARMEVKLPVPVTDRVNGEATMRPVVPVGGNGKHETAASPPRIVQNFVEPTGKSPRSKTVYRRDRVAQDFRDYLLPDVDAYQKSAGEKWGPEMVSDEMRRDIVLLFNLAQLTEDSFGPDELVAHLRLPRDVVEQWVVERGWLLPRS